MSVGRSNRLDPPTLIKKVLSGEVSVADALKYLPDPPRLSPSVNRVIDEALHPLAEGRPEALLLDSALHAVAEVADTLASSLVKTLRYNAPKLLEACMARRG